MQLAVIKMLDIIHINNQHVSCLCAIYIEWDSLCAIREELRIQPRLVTRMQQ